jgi:hypothetical protein
VCDCHQDVETYAIVVSMLVLLQQYRTVFACEHHAGRRYILTTLGVSRALLKPCAVVWVASAGSFSLTVEVADWDLRAQLSGIPRALSSTTAAAAAAAAAEPSSQSVSARSATPAATAAAAGEASGVHGSPAVGSSPADSPRAARQRSDAASLQAAAAEATAAAAAGEGDGGSLGAAAVAAAQMAAVGALGSSVQQPPPVAVLDLVVKAFDTHRWVHACTRACLWQALLVAARSAGCTVWRTQQHGQLPTRLHHTS